MKIANLPIHLAETFDCFYFLAEYCCRQHAGEGISGTIMGVRCSLGCPLHLLSSGLWLARLGEGAISCLGGRIGGFCSNAMRKSVPAGYLMLLLQIVCLFPWVVALLLNLRLVNWVILQEWLHWIGIIITIQDNQHSGHLYCQGWISIHDNQQLVFKRRTIAPIHLHDHCTHLQQDQLASQQASETQASWTGSAGC